MLNTILNIPLDTGENGKETHGRRVSGWGEGGQSLGVLDTPPFECFTLFTY